MQTHRLLLTGLLAGLLLGGCKKNSRDFGGDWMWVDGLEDVANGGGQPREAFCLALRQRGDKIVGVHAAMKRYGDLIDAARGQSIQGYVQGQVAYVTFDSGVTSQQGKAKLEVIDGKLHWTITRADFVHFLPDHVVLEKRTRGPKGLPDGPLLK